MSAEKGASFLRVNQNHRFEGQEGSRQRDNLEVQFLGILANSLMNQTPWNQTPWKP